MVKRLKYLSIKALIGAPNFQIRPATRKNLKPRLTNEAITKTGKLISHTPAKIVKSLYGIGVKPAIPTAKALYSL